MALQKINFQPGINREGTSYDNEFGWFDCNLVRFRMGRPEKFGGWEKLTNDTYLGTGRALFNWTSLEGTKYLGLGTTFKYYVLEGNSFADVTPIRATTTNGIVFAATNGSSTITATDSNHGAVTGDFVTIASAASLGGLITAGVLNQEHQITSVPSVNTFTFTATATANASDSGNGGSGADAVYQINVGLDVFVQGTGWGAGPWSAGTFGSVTSLTSVNQLRLWSHDNFGEDLIINPRAGGIFKWIESSDTSTRAVLISEISGANLVPTVGLQVITSEVDRHLIVLGADPIEGAARSGVIDPMLVAFSDQENELDFEPRNTNTAGSLRLSSGSQIIGAVKSRQEIIIFTDNAVYSMQFIGPPFTFGINLVNENTGLVGPNAAVTAPNGIYFMSYDSFYLYNSTVQQLPCTVLDYVFSDINKDQAYKITAFTNNKHSEVGWYYPSSSSLEIDRYVIYNYQEKVWYYGQLSRTAWLDSGVQNYPQAVNDGYLYRHEIGFNDDGAEMTNVFIESSDFDIGDGEQFSFISRVIPDIKFLDSDTGSNINLLTKTRNFPGDTLTTAATSNITSTTQQNFIRARGRQAVIRISSNDGDDGNVGVGWRLGSTRYDIRSDGRR
tara:strand:- start:2663 stop:4504 length:1842 start_codon:yes stop_codon:yes gene_type:complete